jgi:glycosyltransferase involved in cell wall biosynthesis
VKVLYDTQVFSWQRFGGISRYFVELMRNMSAKDVTPLLPAPFFSENAYIADLGVKLPVKRLDISSFRVRKKLYEWANNSTAKRQLRSGTFDLFHPTYYNDYFLSALGEKPFVLTIHDFTHERYPDMMPDASKVIRRKEKLARAATRIIAISENTRRDIIDHYGIDAAKIDVIHHGYSQLSTVAARVEGIEHPYILFVGDRRRYKNFNTLAEAFAKLARTNSALRLVCTGSELAPAEEKLLNVLGVRNKVITVQATNAQLLWLYRNAECFVYPSLYEGFGLPILEAFGAGCPVAVSSTSCFPEVARDGAAYFNPEDPDDIASTVERVINDTDATRTLTRRASAILRDYSWTKTARATAATYRAALR